tara:strand:+ start:260 stop:523 length:264 start_codon:yes stop_codon:yes gene_type:complete
MSNINTKPNIIIILKDTPEGHQKLDAAKYIPGDVVEKFEKKWFADGKATNQQKIENNFYLSCAYCQVTLTEERKNGHRPDCVAYKPK